MYAPVLGPADPNDAFSNRMPSGVRNHWAGHAEDATLNSYVFDEQYHAFHSKGYAVDPGMGVHDVVVNKNHAAKEATSEALSRSSKKQRTDADKKKAHPFDPHAPFVLKSRQPWADKESPYVAAAAADEQLTEEQKRYAESLQQQKQEAAAAGGGDAKSQTQSESSVFHGFAEQDYQGRSWIQPPPDTPHPPETCFLPKRSIHTWSGHTKGVNVIRLYPDTGHLLLSGGLDGVIKVWDVARDKKCMRTYNGHSKGVKDVCFARDGRSFVSCAYDKTIKAWDTETGQVTGRYGDGQMAYTVRLHPDQTSHPEVLLAGMQNKKIMQYDMRSGEAVQQYDYHLGPVNSITFIDENRRFVSTGDDKIIRIWEFGIPVQIKYMADPSLHAIYTATTSPNRKWWIGQSADNQIVTYSANDRMRQNRKKTFKGHSTAGYACQVGISYDNKYVVSGSGDGKLFIWDWKTTKIVRSLKAHDGVCIGVEWHPLEMSKVVTCGWDGLIKYWD